MARLSDVFYIYHPETSAVVRAPFNRQPSFLLTAKSEGMVFHLFLTRGLSRTLPNAMSVLNDCIVMRCH